MKIEFRTFNVEECTIGKCVVCVYSQQQAWPGLVKQLIINLILNQLEKLEAAKVARLICLSIPSQVGFRIIFCLIFEKCC